jgi:release factor glutamine methyltransferase
VTIRAALSGATAQIAGVSPTPRLDAELLMAHALGVERGTLLLSRLDDPIPAAFASLVERRLRHEPIAYIIGMRDFWTISLAVGPGVLVPRADSETLIEAAVDHFAGTAGPRSVLDLGTGSGALLLAALDQWPDASGVGIDASGPALMIAEANAATLGMAARATFRRGGWDGDGRAHDLILCNPPYVESDALLPREVAEWEPASALFAGADGLDDYRAIAPVLRRQLAPGGVACVEIGSDQAESARSLFADAGFDAAVRHDLGDRPRCLVLTRGTNLRL